jgi:hypothetical protein
MRPPAADMATLVECTPDRSRCDVTRMLFLVGVMSICIMSTFLMVLDADATEASAEVFGVESLSNTLDDQSEAPITQAGSHPYALTTTFVFNHKVLKEESIEPGEEPIPTQLEEVGSTPEKVEVSLPRGMIVNPTAPPTRCTEAQLESGSCPLSSAVGVLRVAVAVAGGFPYRAAAAIYDMVAPTGTPGQFAANLAGLGFVVHIDGRVRSAGDYDLSAEVTGILKTFPLYVITSTFWGNPSDPSHDPERGICANAYRVAKAREDATCPVEATEAALLTMPSSCSSEPLVMSAEVESWPEADEPERTVRALSSSPAVTGCGELGFEPTIEVQPVENTPMRPTGLHVNLHMPQNETLGGLGDANLREAVVTLPAGMSANPSFAGGREACSPAQIGLQIPSSETQAITVGHPIAETFTLHEQHGDEQTTAPLPANASAASVQEALEGLPEIGAGNVKVSEEVTGGWEVHFGGALAGREVPLLAGKVADHAYQQVTVEGTGGTYKLELEGKSTSSLPYFATAEAVGKELEALGKGKVTVTGGSVSDPYTGARSPFTVVFASEVPMTSTSELTGPDASVIVTAHPASEPTLAVAVTEEGGATRFASEVFNPGTGKTEVTACPSTSKIGTVEVTTPLLDHPLAGSVYLAAQEDNPFNSLFAIYLVIHDPVSGVIVKLAGHVELGGESEGGTENGLPPGQIRTTFTENPQLPVEEVKLDLAGGERAPLVTPASCGPATTTTLLTPWSAPEGQAAMPSSTFEFQCGTAPPPGFNPSFLAGVTNNQAGASSTFTLQLSREDHEQDFHSISTTMPPGLLATLRGVPRCGEAEANDGTCSAASQIGETVAAAGVGEPVWVEGGRIYLTGPYNGAPFGLSIVVPAVAGPFNLGTKVVRAGIQINPTTAQPTVTTNASEPYDIPSILRGVPLYIRNIDATINRSNFILNPTNCSPLEVTGTITSTTGTSDQKSSPFEAAHCANLPFTPKLTASVAAHASKANGTSFDVKLESAGVGQANIHKVDLQLPIALPSRLTTLQKACLAATFEANPAACSPESVIGQATIRTPVLSGPLSGPAYLVSHGGEEFPNVEFVLTGEGVTFILDGKTDIKHGITYSKFETAPDAPFTTFETELPAGPHSILAANAPSPKNPYDLCGTNLAMPTEIIGQNGAVIKDTTTIATPGCPPSLTITKATIKGNAVLVTVKLDEAGTLRITGSGLKSVTKRAVTAGTHIISVPLSSAGRVARRHHRKLRLKATEIVAGLTSTATRTLKA